MTTAVMSTANQPRLAVTRVVATLLLCCFCILLTTQALAQEQRPLNLAWSLYPGYSPFVIAFKKGMIRKNGGKVKPLLYKFAARQMPDFESGLLDGGFFSFADALAMAARAPGKSRLVLVADNSDGADLVVAAAQIKSVADLKGKRIGTGIGSFRELLVRKMLQQHGLSVNDVTLVNMGPDEIPEALPDSIQAGQTWDPFSTQSLSRGAHIIFTSAQTPGLIPDVLIFRNSVIEQRPADVQAVVDAWFEALQFWKENPAQGNAIIAAETGRNPETLSTEGIKLLNREQNIQAFTDKDTPHSLHQSGQVNVDFMLTTGVLNNTPDLGQFLDPSFLLK